MSRTTRRIAATTIATVATLALGASAAQATITLDDNTPTSGQLVTATVTSAPAGATHFTLGECNVASSPSNWGRDCNGASGRSLGFTPLSAGSGSGSINVDNTFVDFSFGGGAPLFASTDCNADLGTDPCAAVVSYYRVAGGPPVQLGGEKADLTF